MNNQAKLKLEKIKKLKLPEKVRATAEKIEKGLSSADAATQKKAEDALNKLYDQIKAVAAKQREEKTEKEVNEKTIVPQNSDIAAPAAKKELTKKTTVADDVIDKALKNDPELAGFGRSDKRRDAGRKALPAGRRVARKGWSNQFGKSDGGRVYYENRENRKDRKSPSYKSGYPYLAKGGKIHPMDDEDGTFYVNLYKTKGDQIMSVDEREYSSKASAMTYAMMKRDFMKEGESIFVMNDDGDVLYTSIGTKKMAMGGKFPYQNAQVGDSARVILDNKMGTIMVTYGRRFHLKFPDGTEKTYSAEELEFYPEDEMMAKGGDIQSQTFVVKNLDGKIVLKTKSLNKASDYHGLVGRDTHTVETLDGRILSAMGGYMAEGGVVNARELNKKIKDWYTKTYPTDELGKEINEKITFKGLWAYMSQGVDVYNVLAVSDSMIRERVFEKLSEIYGVDYDVVYKMWLRSDNYAKGGYMAEGENYEYVNTFKRFDSNVPVPDEDFEKLVDAYHKQLSGDKLAVSKYKVLKLQMGNYLGHKTVEEMEAYIEKTHNAHKMSMGGYMADGGVIGNGKNGYVAFYKGKRVEVYADTMYGAQKTAAQYFKAKRESDVNVVLAEVDGKPYIQSTAFAKGGYVSKRDIEAITIVNPNKSNPKNQYLTFRSGEFLNGLNQFAKGGKLTDNYTYIKRSDVFAVYYKDKSKKYFSLMENKPKNGFWVSKKALIREGGKTPSAANAPFDAYESYDEFAKLNYKVWDKLKIESGSEIYASDSLQKKLAVEYPNSGIDAKFKSLKAIQRKKVAEIMTDENEHSLRNYLTLRGYLGQKEYDGYERIFDPKSRYVLNPANFKNYTADKVKVGSVLTSNTGVKLKVVEYNPQFGVKVLRLDATAADKPSQYMKLSKFNGFEEESKKIENNDDKATELLNKLKKEGKVKRYFDVRGNGTKYFETIVPNKSEKGYYKRYESLSSTNIGTLQNEYLDEADVLTWFKNTLKKMASGGKIGFEALSKKVASRYAGKNVKPKYQGEYGKTYDKAEAKEVGDKVAAKVYRMQQGKMAMGGKIELPHQLDRYFTKPSGTIEVEMSKLIPIRARKSGIENAEVYMKKAYDGEMSKRKPIEIYKTRNKKYRVNDGNSTYAVAKKNGWETIYATVVSNPNVKNRVEKSTFAIAKEIRKEGESWSDAVKRVKENRK